ncbi:hypothetical protein RBB50_012531 [Rhinocladiella similis]
MDPHTKELIYLGIHPEQLRLEPYYFLKYSVAKTVKAYWEANKVLAKRQSIPPPPLRRVGNLPPPSGYNRDFEVANILDYHSFAYERHELFSCGNPTCQQHMRRLQELNSRLKEDLERPRVKVAEASMSLINYCNQTRDYMVPSVWGHVDRKEDPYNPQSGGSDGCCSVM